MDNFLGLIQHNDTHKPVPHKHTEVIYDHNLSHFAEQCIAGLALSNANYYQAICLLRERAIRRRTAHCRRIHERPTRISPSIVQFEQFTIFLRE